VGVEGTPEAYIASLVEIFAECKRVLRDDGTLWANLGDSFSGSGGSHKKGGKNPGLSKSDTRSGATEDEAPATGNTTGIKAKNLIGIPFMAAFALRDAGWYWRAIIPWEKKNCMPSSTLDRPTIGTEYWLMFSKSPKYYYDQFAVLQPFADKRQGADGSGKKRVRNVGGRTDGYTTPNGVYPEQNGGRFRRDTDWFMESLQIIQETGEGALLDENGDILAMHFNPGNARWEYCKHCDTLYNNKQIKYIKDDKCYQCGRTDGWVKHYAAYPLEMIEPLIRACTSEYGCCATCGAPYIRVMNKATRAGTGAYNAVVESAVSGTKIAGTAMRGNAGKNLGTLAKNTIGWQASCKCNAEMVPSTCLDPFSGTGTTGIAALMHGRDYIGCELGADYAKASAARLRAAGQPSKDVLPGQLALEGV